LHNSSSLQSNFVTNTKLYYNNTQITNINLLYILLVKFINNYNINYTDQNNDIENIIANIRIGTSYINDTLETLKGYTPNNYISTDIIKFNTDDLTKLINNFNRSRNITQLSVNVDKIKNFSTIIPIDYDYDVINFNFNNIYDIGIDIYKKYYSYDYNFYQYKNNYLQIYTAKLTYYNSIIANTNSLTNIKDFNNSLFNDIFNDIVHTILSIPYFNYETDNSIFVDPFNQLISLYMQYNFTFRINNNISPVENLKIQSYFKIQSKNTMDLESLNDFIDRLYFYELYNIPINDINKNSQQADFIYLLHQLEETSNYSFEYNNNVINYVFKLEKTFELISWFINKNYKLNIINENIIKIFLNDLVLEIGNVVNISNFFRNSYLYYNDNYNNLIYKKVVNTINYNDFINCFSLAVQYMVYYTDNISILIMLENIYNMYFKNKVFYYKEYIENDYIIKSYNVSIK
jgi:hypothetical protein